MTGSTKQNTFYFYRGRVALGALLRALNLKAGDEVLLQAFTCLAVPSPIVGLGLRPVYLDITRRSYNLDPDQMEGRITGRTRAIIVQHTFGIPAEMAAIIALAKKHKLAVIEDCCHVLGSRYQGEDLGCIGDAAFYSYEWGKPFVIGLGGAAVVHSPELSQKVRSLYEKFVFPPLKDRILDRRRNFENQFDGMEESEATFGPPIFAENSGSLRNARPAHCDPF
jgi:dTDP-4-amino-4,6-dideoxygalactose transaminase